LHVRLLDIYFYDAVPERECERVLLSVLLRLRLRVRLLDTESEMDGDELLDGVGLLEGVSLVLSVAVMVAVLLLVGVVLILVPLCEGLIEMLREWLTERVALSETGVRDAESVCEGDFVLLREFGVTLTLAEVLAERVWLRVSAVRVCDDETLMERVLVRVTAVREDVCDKLRDLVWLWDALDDGVSLSDTVGEVVGDGVCDDDSVDDGDGDTLLVVLDESVDERDALVDGDAVPV